MVKKTKNKSIPAIVGKHPGGRPTKYYPELCDDIIEFFDRPLYVTKTLKTIVDEKEIKRDELVPNMTPFLIDWCMKHKISADAPSEWAKIHPEFSEAYNKAKRLQERFLAELGIKGDHNGFMTFQTLKNVAGWRDKTEVKHSGGVVSTNVDVEGKSVEELIRMLNGN